MTKGKLCFALISVLFLLASIGNAKAQEEYSLGVKICPLLTLSNDCYEPKIACANDHSSCVALYYDVGFTTGIKLLYSTNGFNTTPPIFSTSYVVSSCVLNTSQDIMNYSMEYDVAYNQANGRYYFLVPNPSDCSGANGAKIFSWAITDGASPRIETTLDTISPLISGFVNWYPIGIVDKETIPKAVVIHGYCSLSSNPCPLSLGLQRYYLFNGSFIDTQNINSFIIFGCNGLTLGNGGYQYARGFSDWNGSLLKYALFVNVNCGIPSYVDTQNNINNLGSFPSDRNGLSYYLDNYLFYTRTANLSGNISAGVWRTLTSDLQTYQPPTLYYPFNTSIAETIPLTSYNRITGFTQYAFEKYNNDTGKAAYSYAKPLIPIYIQALDNSSSPIPISATLQCISQNYTQTAISNPSVDAGLITLNSPCSTNITISFDTSNYVPTHNDTTFDIPSGCSFARIPINYQNKSLTVPIRVIDAISGNPIAGALVSVNANTFLTNSNGIVNVLVQPLTNTNFRQILTIFNPPACNVPYLTTGDFAQNSLIVSASGYLSYSNISATFPTTVPPSQQNIQLLPTSAQVEVHLYTSDGVEVNPLSAITGENGSALTYVSSNGNYIITNTIEGNLPVTFLLIDNRSNWTTNISVAYQNTTVYQELMVSQNGFYSLNFNIPFLSSEFPCSLSSDCKTTYCKGIYLNTFTGCTNNLCTYTTQQCLSSLLCDSSTGCFNALTNISCTSDFDCNTTCFNSNTMSIGKCLSSGICGAVFKSCNTGCNSSLGNGLCNELAQCVSGTSKTFSVDFYKNGNKVMGAETTVPCDLSKAGKKFCVPSVDVKKSDLAINGLTITNAQVFPQDLIYTETSDAYYFYPISVTCSNTCNITYELCGGTCNFNTGECVGGGVPVNVIANQAGALFAAIGGFLNIMFPNILAKTIASIILIILVVLGVTFALNKVNHSSNWQVGLGLAILLALGLAFEGWIDPLLTILFCVIAAFLIVRYTFWTSTG